MAPWTKNWAVILRVCRNPPGVWGMRVGRGVLDTPTPAAASEAALALWQGVHSTSKKKMCVTLKQLRNGRSERELDLGEGLGTSQDPVEHPPQAGGAHLVTKQETLVLLPSSVCGEGMGVLGGSCWLGAGEQAGPYPLQGTQVRPSLAGLAVCLPLLCPWKGAGGIGLVSRAASQGPG